MINGLHVCSEILEQQSLVFRLHMETIILIYSSRLENEVNNLTLENTKPLSWKITCCHCSFYTTVLLFCYRPFQSHCYVNLDIWLILPTLRTPLLSEDGLHNQTFADRSPRLGILVETPKCGASSGVKGKLCCSTKQSYTNLALNPGLWAGFPQISCLGTTGFLLSQLVCVSSQTQCRMGYSRSPICSLALKGRLHGSAQVLLCNSKDNRDVDFIWKLLPVLCGVTWWRGLWS